MSEREGSLILEKVFSALRSQGAKRTEVLEQLCFPLDELSALTFNNHYFMKTLTGDGIQTGKSKITSQLKIIN
jgi:hypothetical protein